LDLQAIALWIAVSVSADETNMMLPADAIVRPPTSVCNLVIVGTGMAGWCAALRAKEMGLSVTTLDVSDSPPGWNNSRISGGVFHAAYLDPLRPAQDILDATIALTDGHANARVARAYAENCARTFRWLQSRGIAFGPGGDREYRRYVLRPERPSETGILWEDYGPDLLLRGFHDSFRQLGGTARFGARATRVSLARGGWWVTEAETATGAERFESRCVLLADGGFQASDTLLKRYVGAGLDSMMLRGVASSEGDCLRFGLDVGAAVANMQWFYGRCLSRDALQHPDLSLYPMLDEIVRAGIVVGIDGRRIADEGLGEVALANAIARSPSARDAWLILDAEQWRTAGRRGRIPADPHLSRGGGTVLSAASLDDLARLAGVKYEGLRDTITSYNKGQNGGVLSPPRTAPSTALIQEPFFAVPLIGSISFTMGGLLIGSDAQVLNTDGTPIDGLYAAGGSMGGLQGGPRGGYLGGLVEAAVFGLLAAEHSASVAGESGLHSEE
jgi:fumarate reductase flavoprotein subunit